MIRTVSNIWVHPIEEDSWDWTKLDIVPASARLKTEEKNEDVGRIKIYHLTATLLRRVDEIDRNLKIRVDFDEGVQFFGSDELPVRFEVKEENSLEISCKFNTIVEI